MDLTDGTLLGGRVSYRQLRDGYRTGIEPVLLAASISAKPGERVLEGGTGAGAGLLCLLARVPDVKGFGVERDEDLAGLARDNLRANGHDAAGIAAVDLRTMPPGDAFDHAMANPPWHGEHSSASADGRRDTAKRAEAGLLQGWAAALARPLRPGGSLTFVLPAARLAEGFAGLDAAGCGDPALLPLWPRAGLPAKIVLLRGRKARRGPCRVAPGLILHEDDGYSAEARAILWEGAALPWPA